MNRNVESHFSLLPSAEISRSTFDRSHSVKTSWNVGDVVPFFVDEVLPGDTFQVKSSKVVRLQTLLTPFMDNIYLDTYYYFVPNRLVWKHWKQFMGENTESAWVPQTEYSVPVIKSPDGGFAVGTIADYMGIPTGVPNLEVNALPFRAYALIMNEWFRDQNLQDPLVIPDDDATVQGVNTGDQITDIAKGGLPFIAAKYHDYFTSALPSPQKGPDVLIPVSNPKVSLSGSAPVVTGANIDPSLFTVADAGHYERMRALSSDKSYKSSSDFLSSGVAAAGSTYRPDGSLSVGQVGTGSGIIPANLYARLDGSSVDIGSGVMASINQLRLAFQLQKLYERDSRSGSRYIELLKSHFGVTSPDARLQRPEYLGGNRVPINVNQVIQQSGTESSGTPQGNVAAMSLTTDVNYDFVHSFVEHGFVIGVMVARYDHTYQQGLERMWSRKGRFDYYWPALANIGEQAIKNKEIYAQGSAKINPSSNKPYDDEVFGYQEAWADYRYKPNHVTGEMRSSYSQSLDSWHLADDYDSMPFLSASWIREDKNVVDRVLAVSSRLSDQLFGDIFIQNRTTRPMPLYSIPGLIDHN